MKAEKISMKWKVFGYFLGFTAVLIIILWFMQIVYLDTFYRKIKEDELDRAASYVQENIAASNVQEIIEDVAKEYDVSILITDGKGVPLYKTDEGSSQIAFWLSSSQFFYYYEKALEEGGKADVVFEGGDGGETPAPHEMDEGAKMPGKEHFFGNGKNQVKRMLGIRLVETEETEMVILLESLLTPVDATVNTLRTQLVYISVVTIVLSLILALLLSKSISKSIGRINESAKKLGKGEFDVVFDGKDYKEIAELSGTLNKAAAELAKVENLQRELIANVSHDLRTPLTMITAYSEVMRDIPGENTTENVQIVIEEAQRLTNLVNDMLDVSKLQAGATKLNCEVYDFTAGV